MSEPDEGNFFDACEGACEGGALFDDPAGVDDEDDESEEPEEEGISEEDKLLREEILGYSEDDLEPESDAEDDLVEIPTDPAFFDSMSADMPADDDEDY